MRYARVLFGCQIAPTFSNILPRPCLAIVAATSKLLASTHYKPFRHHVMMIPYECGNMFRVLETQTLVHWAVESGRIPTLT